MEQHVFCFFGINAEEEDDKSFTIGSISCGERTIAVGSYLSGVTDLELSPFSAEGPTRDGKQKPEVSASRQFLHPFWEFGILAARWSTQDSVRMSGTSMASPHVAGLIALLMQVAPRPLTIDEIRVAVINNARKNPPSSGYGWHSRYGFGRVDATSTILSQLEHLPIPLPATEPKPSVFTQRAIGNELHSVENLISTLVRSAKDSNTHIRFQVEMEPLSGRGR